MDHRSEIRGAANKALESAANGNSALTACIDSQKANGQSSLVGQDRVLYVTAEVTDTPTRNWFEDIVKDAIGVTNFDGGQLNATRNAAIDSIKLEYGTLPVANVLPFETAVKGVDFNASAPAIIKNAELIFEVDGKRIIELPVSDVHNPNTTRSNDEMYRELGHLPVITAQQPVTCKIDFPSGVSLDKTVVRHFVKLSLRVSETVSR